MGNNIKQFLKRKKLLDKVKKIVGSNTSNALKAIQHTSDCVECAAKFQRITDHCNATNNQRFGIVRVIKHLPKCSQCQTDFAFIANHAGTRVDIKALENQ